MTWTVKDIDIVYQDESLLCVAKPSQMLVHRGWGQDNVVLVGLLRQLLNVDVVYPIHRLDRATSGVIAFALDPESAAHLCGAFERGEIKKRYLALVRGCPPDEGVIDHPLARQPGGLRVPARTTFRRLNTAPTEPRHVSLVEAHPQSGRYHQVRRHLKHLGFPIIGDANYGKGDLNRLFAARYGLTRLALHAAELELPHPSTLLRIRVRAPMPTDLSVPFARMGIEGWDNNLP